MDTPAAAEVDEMTYLGVASSSRVSLMMRCTTLAGMDPAGNLQASGARSTYPEHSPSTGQCEEHPGQALIAERKCP